MSQQKVAIVHDWLIGGGAEKVIEALHQMYPEAPIYTSYASQEWRDKLDNRVVTGYLQHWPFSRLRKFIPILRIWWFQSLDFSNYDVVISSSGAEAKGIKTSKPTFHINYCHAPTHYYWNRYDDYLHNPGFGVFNPLARLGLRLLVGPLRKWDYKAAQRPDAIIANSSFTQKQIKQYYNRDSTVIFPPVAIEKFKPKTNNVRAGFVIAGRQTPYKRFDLAVLACSELDLPLLVIGSGPDHDKLKKMAGSSISFKPWVSDDDIVKAFQSAEGFIFPGTDDFGIVAVEALAAGCPVIAYKDGGTLDYITPGRTGEFFEKQTSASLADTLKIFRPSEFKQASIVASAEKFNTRTFMSHIQSYLAAQRT